MTRDEILSMKPGRELDRLIGEHIFGYKNILNVADYWFIDDLNTSLPHYSTDIAAAFEVLEKFDGYEIKREPYTGKTQVIIYSFANMRMVKAEGKSVPEAASKCALLAVTEE